MKKRWLQFFVIALIGVNLTLSSVFAIGPDSTKPYILINPFLSSTTMRNGDTLAIKANVDSNFSIVRGYAQIEGFSFQIPMVLKSGTDKSGFWIGTWQGKGLQDKTYSVAVTFIDSTGHSWTDRSAYFTDPIAGYDRIGNENITETFNNYIIAQKVNFDEKIDKINAIKIYIRNSGGLFRVGLYSENKDLIWQSSLIQNTYYNEWVEIPMSSGTYHNSENLDDNTYYIAIQSLLTDNIWGLTYDEGANLELQKYLFNAFPQKINLQNGKKPYKLSAYVIYNEQYRFVKNLLQSFFSLFE